MRVKQHYNIIILAFTFLMCNFVIVFHPYSAACNFNHTLVDLHQQSINNLVKINLNKRYSWNLKKKNIKTSEELIR